MTHPTRAAMSTRTYGRLDNLRCAIAWKIPTTGRRLETFAHRLSDGDHPTPTSAPWNTFTRSARPLASVHRAS